MKLITIIGGGLAGLALGIGLRQHRIPVTLLESGNYPRHRVCGEFISGKGLRVMHELGLVDRLTARGGRSLSSIQFFSSTRTSPPFSLPHPALGLSRHDLDHALAEEFSTSGGTLHCGARFGEQSDQPGRVFANGRRAPRGGSVWFGLKAHAENVQLAADLEMHFLPRAYIGICRLNQSKVNVCGLFRKSENDPLPRQDAKLRLCGEPHSLIREKLTHAKWVDASVCAVAGLPLPTEPDQNDRFSIGDARAMIAPLTGNGMSMALESAQLALPLLARYSAGQYSWQETKTAYAGVWRTTFKRRIFWGNLMQQTIFQNFFHPMLLPLLSSGWFWRPLFHFTR